MRRHLVATIGAALLVAGGAAGCAAIVGLNSIEEVPCVGAACADASANKDTAVTPAEASPDTAIDSGGEADTATTDAADSTVLADADAAMDLGSGDVLADNADVCVLGSPTACGMCGRKCSTTNVDKLACTTDQCTSTCKPGFANCVTPPSPAADDGCETPTSGVLNCGGCGQKCDVTNSTGAVCDGKTCAYASCKPGFGNCKTDAPDTDGCETPITTTLNCGGCGIACDSAKSVGTACTGGACTYTGCKAGFADCNKTPPNSDGCETAINTATNCGVCGRACETINSVGAACSGGTTCTYTGCNAGFANCKTAAPDTDGCETPVSSDVNNCGGCAHVCSKANASAVTCSAGVCTATCNTGFLSCKTPPSTAPDDGCECEGNGCCAGDTCQKKHNNGFGGSYFHCNALGTPGNAATYDVGMATAAAESTPGTGTIGSGTCTATGALAVVKDLGGAGCTVFTYTGSTAGYAHRDPAGCFCPLAGESAWN